MPKKKKPNPRYLPGRRSPSKSPGGPNSNQKWYMKFHDLKMPKHGEKRELRMVGGLFTIFQHYVKGRREDGSTYGFYLCCPDFDWSTGEFRRGPDACCPICEDFSSRDLPEDLQFFGSYRYYTDAFDISAAKAGNVEDVFGVLWTNKYGMGDLADIGDIVGHDVDDESNGCTVFWRYEPKAKDPKDRTKFYQGKKMPVYYDEDEGVYVLKGGGKVFKGEPTNFAEIVEVKSAAEIRADLTSNGAYERLEEYLEVNAPTRPDNAPSHRSSVEDDEDSDDSWGDGDEEETPPKKKAKKNKAPAKKKPKKKDPEPESEEDEAWDDEPDSPASEDAADGWGADEDDGDDGDGDWGDDSSDSSGDDSWGADEDDGDGWSDEDAEEEEEEEEEPPKKSAPKKKKAKKKPDPEPEPDDADDFDDDDDW